MATIPLMNRQRERSFWDFSFFISQFTSFTCPKNAIDSEVLPNSQCRYPNSFHAIIISWSFSFQQFYYYDVINIKDRKVYTGVADCFNLVFITCGINLMISAHCTNAATKPDTLYYVLWRKKKPWVTPYWKKTQSNKPAAEHIFLVSLSMGGESEGQRLT